MLTSFLDFNVRHIDWPKIATWNGQYICGREIGRTILRRQGYIFDGDDDLKISPPGSPKSERDGSKGAVFV